MTFFDRLRALFSSPSTSESTENFRAAIRVSKDLIDQMRKDQDSRNPVTALMADIWMQRHNMPYMTTIYEAVQEVETAVAWSEQTRRRRDKSE
jgi:hypothetical protein